LEAPCLTNKKKVNGINSKNQINNIIKAKQEQFDSKITPAKLFTKAVILPVLEK